MPITSILGRILTAVHETVKHLDIEGFTAAQIKKQKLPYKRDRVAAGLFVTPTPEIYRPGVSNCEDDIGYGVAITMLQASNQSLEFDDDSDIFIRNRDRIIEHYLPTTDVPLPAVPEVYTVEIEPGPVFDPGAFAAQFDGSGFVLRFWVRKLRRQ